MPPPGSYIVNSKSIGGGVDNHCPGMEGILLPLLGLWLSFGCFSACSLIKKTREKTKQQNKKENKPGLMEI